MMHSLVFLGILLLAMHKCSSFNVASSTSLGSGFHQLFNPTTLFGTTYDEWRSDLPVDTLPLEEDFVNMVLDEIVHSDDGMQMFGVHDRAGN